MSLIKLYDTTLRDGTQAENFNLSVDDKIKVCRQLDRLGEGRDDLAGVDGERSRGARDFERHRPHRGRRHEPRQGEPRCPCVDP